MQDNTNSTSQAQQEKRIRWLDFSMYGMRLVCVTTPTGDRRLMMMGGDKFTNRVQKLGFRKYGSIWLRASTKITFQEVISQFESVKIKEMTYDDVMRIMRPKQTSEDAQYLQEKNALSNLTPIGINAKGDDVYMGAEGRFIKLEDGKILRESDAGYAPGLFLLANTQDDLELCADAVIERIQAGQFVHTDDLDVFAQHIFNLPKEQVEVQMPSLNDAINHALTRVMMRNAKDAGRNTFNLAVKIHEGLPPLDDDLASKIVPLPIGVVAQRIAGISDGQSLYIPHISNGSLVSTISDEVTVYTDDAYLSNQENLRLNIKFKKLDLSEQVPAHHVSIVNLEKKVSAEEINALGTKINRVDHAEVMNLLSRREIEGKSIVLLKSGKKPGKVDDDSVKLLSWISARYSVEGIVELDGSLFGKGGSALNRYMVVIGDAGQSNLLDFSKVSVIYDNEKLWSWADEFVSEQQRIRERPALLENSFQAPYQSASRIGTPSKMIPRNLVGPTREALAKIEEEFGLVDDIVSEGIQMSKEEMAECFEPEQIDAIAMGIAAHKRGKALIEGDQTGLGKGRVLAGLARYAAMNNMPIVFITEKDDLFRDFYRDIIDTHSQEILRPYFLNVGASITMNGKRVLKGMKKAEIDEFIDNKTMPEGANMMMATYTQFNRDNHANNERKAEYLKAISQDAMIILDEAHNAAGLSNTGFNVYRALRNGGGVVYSSATFAKDSKNFGIYSKVMPPSVSTTSLGDVLSKGGDPLTEVFSAMLAEDAVFIRREIDLSRLVFVPAPNDKYYERNEQYADKLAEILEAIGLMRGEINNVVNERNAIIKEKWTAATKTAMEALNEDVRSSRSRKGRKPSAKSKKAQKPDSSWMASNPGTQLYTTGRQFFLSINADYAADLAIQALKEGRKPIVTVETTNESLLRTVLERSLMDAENFKSYEESIAATIGNSNEEGAEQESDSVNSPAISDEDMSDFMDDIFNEIANERTVKSTKSGINDDAEDSVDDETLLAEGKGSKIENERVLTSPITFRDILHRMLDKMTVIRHISLGKVDKTERMQSDAVMKLRKAVEMKIDAFPDIYVSPIDVVRQRIEEAGYVTAEVSGRKIGVTLRPDGSQVVKSLKKGAKGKIIDQFNQGYVDALVLTVAGASGISLHASEKFADQRQREMIELQVANNVTTRLQTLGRANRNGQVCAPIIRTIDSLLPAESRLISMQRSKLRELSANTTSNRENKILDNDTIDIINSLGDEICHEFLLENKEFASRLMMDESKILELDSPFKMPNLWHVNQVLGRIGMLPVVEQKNMFNVLRDKYTEKINELNAKGQNPFKSSEFDFKAKVGEGRIVYDPVIKTGSVFDKPIMIREISYMKEINAKSSSDVKKSISGFLADNDPKVLNARLTRALKTVEDNRTKSIKESTERYQDNLSSDFGIDSEESLNNRVQQINDKADFILKWAPMLEAGNALKFKSYDGIIYEGIITSMSLPIMGSESYLGQYQAVIEVPGEGKAYRSLNSLFEDEEFNISSDKSEIKRMMKAFDEVTPGSYEVSRQVMDGNLFAACEWSTTESRGISGVYTNENNERQRAVILPTNEHIGDEFTLRLDFAIDLDMAKKYFSMNQYSSTSYVASTKRSAVNHKVSSGGAIAITAGKGGFSLILNKTRENMAFVDSSAVHSIKEMGPELRKRRGESVHLTTQLTEQEMYQAIDEIYASGNALFLPDNQRQIAIDLHKQVEHERKEKARMEKQSERSMLNSL